MRVSLLVVAAVALSAAGAARADDAAAACRSFCDADAKACRREAQEAKDSTISPLDLRDFTARPPSLQPVPDDYTAEKQRAVETAAERDRRVASQQCSSKRMACVQRCAAPAPAPAQASSAP